MSSMHSMYVCTVGACLTALIADASPRCTRKGPAPDGLQLPGSKWAVASSPRLFALGLVIRSSRPGGSPRSVRVPYIQYHTPYRSVQQAHEQQQQPDEGRSVERTHHEIQLIQQRVRSMVR